MIIRLLKNIEGYYSKSDLICRQIIVGSIFLDKVIFEKNYYRTATENYALKLISMPSTDLAETKSGKEGVISYLSTVVPQTGTLSNRLMEILMNLCKLQF